jgi:hypothetical protein
VAGDPRCGTWPHHHLSPHSQVLYNVASAQCQVGLWTEAANTLAEAISKWPEGAQDGLDMALYQVQVRRAGEGGPVVWGWCL